MAPRRSSILARAAPAAAADAVSSSSSSSSSTSHKASPDAAATATDSPSSSIAPAIPPAPVGHSSRPGRVSVSSRAMPDASSSKTVSPTDGANNSNSTVPSPPTAPYGTRSRNRGSAARPNYAEDRDTDLDLELAARPSSRKASSATNTNGGPAPASGSPASAPERVSRRGQHGQHSQHSQHSQHANHTTANGKEIPGTSTFSAVPSHTNGVRKRKQSGPQQAPPAPAAKPASRRFVAPSSVPADKGNGRCMMTFGGSRAQLKNGKLKADDGTVLAPDDHVYLVCEPPGEPYYLGRIMEFLPSKDDPTGPVEAVRVNWFYRPRDIHRKSFDSRLVFATMHSDECPLTSLRGRCTVKHLSEVENLDDFKKCQDCFWFDKMYDRYMMRYYDVVPTSDVRNVPEYAKKALDERWKYVCVELGGRKKELTSDVKLCIKCHSYAANADSVDCAVCHHTYHMYCVRPPLQKKPQRGFAWACAACNRKQERRLEARNPPIIVKQTDPETETEPAEEEEEEEAPKAITTKNSTPAVDDAVLQPATKEQIAQARLWPFRYFGIHCKPEDLLDYDDRIYPRAMMRLGRNHQATVPPWYGHPVSYFKPAESRRRHVKSNNKTQPKATSANDSDKADRPKWVQEEPPGYTPRGEDEPVLVNGKQIHTAELLWRMPRTEDMPARGGNDDDDSHDALSPEDREKLVEDYMEKARTIASSKGIEPYCTNYLDRALNLLYKENYNPEPALAQLKQTNKYSDLKEPHLRPEEVKAFEAGVAKYGSELRLVSKHVRTVPHYQIVRFYYMWKKTPRGQQIWGNHVGRRGKIQPKSDESKLADDVADDQDDSAFDADKAKYRKRGFTCIFCSTQSSRQWRRAPLVAPGAVISDEGQQHGGGSKRDKASPPMLALCQRCAILWRKYGVQWEDPDEVAKRVTQGGSKSWRRRVEEELLVQLLTSSESEVKISNSTASIATGIGIPVSTDMTAAADPPPKKKVKTEKEATSVQEQQHLPSLPPPQQQQQQQQSQPSALPKKKSEKPPEPALVPEPPKPKTLPCAVCNRLEPQGNQFLTCRDCRMSVHAACYGIDSLASSEKKWICDTCVNDRNPVISTTYECVLCPVAYTDHELMEPPRVSHKKKTEREREKERLEREMVVEAIKLYRQRQEAAGKPVGPREPLKRTTGNNWVHVTCALWTPEIKFGYAPDLEPAEGLGLIPPARRRETCKICKTAESGACVGCHNPSCNARFHIGCAAQAGYVMGFDVVPVGKHHRGHGHSRHDSAATAGTSSATATANLGVMKLGNDTGVVTAAIWCPHHSIPSTVHEISEMTDVDHLNALQLFARTYKQADLTLTGTARKAAQIQQSLVGARELLRGNGEGGLKRRHGVNEFDHVHATRNSINNADDKMETDEAVTTTPATENGTNVPENHPTSKRCISCQTQYSPKWWLRSHRTLANGYSPLVAPGYNSGPRPLAVANGDHYVNNALGSKQENSPAYLCHKCHIRGKRSPKPKPPPPLAALPIPAASTTDVRPLHPYPYSRDQAPVSVTPAAQYPPPHPTHPYLPPHNQPLGHHPHSPLLGANAPVPVARGNHFRTPSASSSGGGIPRTVPAPLPPNHYGAVPAQVNGYGHGHGHVHPMAHPPHPAYANGMSHALPPQQYTYPPPPPHHPQPPIHQNPYPPVAPIVPPPPPSSQSVVSGPYPPPPLSSPTTSMGIHYSPSPVSHHPPTMAPVPAVPASASASAPRSRPQSRSHSFSHTYAPVSGPTTATTLPPTTSTAAAAGPGSTAPRTYPPPSVSPVSRRSTESAPAGPASGEMGQAGASASPSLKNLLS